MTTSETGRVLVAGIGNIFLSDDGFGCEVAGLLLERLGQSSPDVVVTDYGIRGMHLAYDLLEGYRGLIIIDAMPRGGVAGDIVVLEVGPEDLGNVEGHDNFDAHGMQPTSVLASLGSLGGRLPATFVVGCEPESIEEGIGLSDRISAVIDAAADQVIEVLAARFGISIGHPGASVGTADRNLAATAGRRESP